MDSMNNTEPQMKILMIQTRRISEDGHNVRLCEQGQEYDLADTAARFAIRHGWATEVDTRTNEERWAETIKSIYGNKAA
jgi:hypothetical protein